MELYVNAWEYDTGGGFDCYYTVEPASEAFDKDASGPVVDLADEGWTNILLAVDISAMPEPERQDPNKVTEWIDEEIMQYLPDTRTEEGRAHFTNIGQKFGALTLLDIARD